MSLARQLLAVMVGLLALSAACLGSTTDGGSPTPNVSPAGGSYASGLMVNIVARPADAAVYYAIDGSEPDDSASVLSPNFTGGSRGITLLASTTVKAFAVVGGQKSATVRSS